MQKKANEQHENAMAFSRDIIHLCSKTKTHLYKLFIFRKLVLKMKLD